MLHAQQAQEQLPTVVIEGVLPRAQQQQQFAVPSNGVAVQQTTAGDVQGYRALTASSATKTNTPVERIPQNISIIPRTVIDDQYSRTVAEAVQNASNTSASNSLIVGNIDIVPVMIRGFGAELWRDGLPNIYSVGDRDGLVNVERIEVLKGPNAILYGSATGSPLGGAINVISKLPLDKPRYEFGVGLGSYQYWNSFFDINTPLNQSKTVLFRITGEYTGNKSFIDILESRRYNINPTLTLTNRNDTALTIQGFLSRQYQHAYPGLPVNGTLGGAYRVNRELYFGHPDIPLSYSKNKGAVVTLDRELNSIWSANVKVKFSESEFDQVSQAPLGFDFTGGSPVLPPSTFDVNNVEVLARQQELTINPTLKAKFNTPLASNTLLLGADYSRIKDRGFMNGDTLGNTCFFLGGPCAPVLVDLSNPSFTVPFTRPVPGVGEGIAFFNWNNLYVSKGAYAQVQSTFANRIHVMGGVRLASININYTENTVAQTFQTDATRALPRAGVVVDLVKGLSAFVSYSEGMRWSQFSTAFTRPAPEFSSQVEAGIKFNLDNQLSGTVAVFDIDRTNVPYLVALGVGGLSTQNSKGFEADAVYQPDRNWSVLASYGYTDATFATATATIPAGNKIPFVSPHSGRLWAIYKFDSEVLRGWNVGAGIYLASGQFVDPANTWKTEGYYTIDAKLGYENERIRASVIIKNLTGEEYFVPYAWLGGQVAPSAPRSVYGQLSYKY